MIPNSSSLRCISIAPTTLRAWSAEPVGKRPSGDTLDELIEELTRMLRDAREWTPVDFDDLRVGMRFERAAIENTAGRGFGSIAGEPRG